MIKQFFAAATIVTALTSIQTEASFVQTDWMTTGDKKAVLDTNTGLEWLRLDQTIGFSVNQNPTFYGAHFSGWRVATQSEVEQMYLNFFTNQYLHYGISGSTPSLTWDEAWASASPSRHYIPELLDLYLEFFGFSDNRDEFSGRRSMGIHKCGTSSLNCHTGFRFYTTQGVDYASFVRGTRVSGNSAGGSIYGIFYVSEGGATLSSILDPTINTPSLQNNQGGPTADVVSPAGLAAAGALLMFLGARRRKLLSK